MTPQMPATLLAGHQVLQKTFEHQGYFRASWRHVWGPPLLGFASMVFVVACLKTMPVVAMAVMTAAQITVVWWIHDVGHQAIVSSRKTSEILAEVMGVIFLGMPQVEYHFDVHRRHHGATNIIGKDGALDTSPIFWHSKLWRSARKMVPHQHLVWLTIVVPFTWPLLTYRGLTSLVKRRKFLRLGAVVLRWLALIALFQSHPLWLVATAIVPSFVAGWVLGFTASLNHFHMPMDDCQLAPFPLSVFMCTQNLSHRSRFATWLTGGLNFHIEHHLFPTMPSANLRKASPLILQFAQTHGLQYQQQSLSQSVSSLYRHLRARAREFEVERAQPPTVPFRG
jgi:fatty acid desaturase